MIRTGGSYRFRGSMLVEAVVALGIASVGILSVIALLGQSTDAEAENRKYEEAMQSIESVRMHFEQFPFEEIYEEVRNPTHPYYSYRYSAMPGRTRDDGTAIPGYGGEARLQSGLRRSDDRLLTEDLSTAQGTVFRLRLSPLAEDDPASTRSPLPELEGLTTASFDVAVEFYTDPQPGINEGEWVDGRRVLRIPVAIKK